ncbi:unnamed protein product [Zymoseptoria tritici ST99CH_1A5]|uniref:NADAR domain-containing protein n=4 Tax=Zymoseptoria tritici TaxID=1047171 RepID=F9XM37_ZYMTI|nr:uncharacterized protein MYCGRDRAFT_49268 [Zymoseptoria tritici IPO323]SMQ55408.1 unnamed protein product [Zymoseptoria tritici ST99CH_3D7]SMR60620.1 unnamed protein product [Zymoseptoria tritici ST99CH_1E4]SMR63732.1 unnamed protein product [Zymoseptoria tritici ST99CH_3D1]SMY29091.1 unnamed protein product [Zymoseptoria tritici ST99CH_1A5]EGP83516.1 hypothetical protein MYCGRDRAFT_49268 [Zymoseptoria tritici IPO323]
MPTSDEYVFFWKPQQKNGLFCQWFHSPFQMDGKQFVTAEQCMMYLKAELFDDSEMMEKIIRTPEKGPAEHKQMGRLVKNFNNGTWDARSLDIVAKVNYNKFNENEDLKKALMDTAGKTLVEASPADRIWGIGYKEEDAIANMNTWGQNRLGKALMAAREEIIDSS